MKLKISNLETNCLDRIEEIGDAEASLISGGAGVPSVEKGSSWLLRFAIELGRVHDEHLNKAIEFAEKISS